MPTALVEIEHAREIVLSEVSRMDGEPVALDAALGRALAEAVRAPAPVPGFASSAMDGYAVRAQDLAGASPSRPVVLSLRGESRAGRPAGIALGAGEAIAISTGAMVPDGADAILRVELTSSTDDLVQALGEVPAGQDMRWPGDDLSAGEIAVSAGSVIGSAELGVLASVGCAAPLCARSPIASLLSTGDELRAPGEPLPPGGVHDSNSYALRALLQRDGAQVSRVSHVGDDPEATLRELSAALEGVDIAVICGGMSVGVHDHVRACLRSLGVQERFSGVALRPGKPTWFGVRGRTLVFGLPGNPLSAFVACVLFVLPAVRAALHADPLRRRASALLAAEMRKEPGRALALPCRLQLRDEGWLAHPPRHSGSHVLTAMLGAEALAIVPSQQGTAHAGERVAIEMLSGGMAR